MGREPYIDQHGVLNIEDKPYKLSARFVAEVEAKVERSAGVGGWAKGPVFICEQANEETVDVPAWLRGLDEFDKPRGVDELVAEIARDSAALFEKIERLKGMYGEGI